MKRIRTKQTKRVRTRVEKEAVEEEIQARLIEELGPMVLRHLKRNLPIWARTQATAGISPGSAVTITNPIWLGEPGGTLWGFGCVKGHLDMDLKQIDAEVNSRKRTKFHVQLFGFNPDRFKKKRKGDEDDK